MDLQEIMRKYFRISVKESSDVSMRINDAHYDVIDVGDSGIGIRLTPEDIFIAAEDQLPIELKIKGVVHKMQGKVVHISPAGPEEYLCGIEFINIDKKSKNKLMEYLQEARDKIFKAD